MFLFVDIIKLTYGNPSLQKTCLHSMVRTLATFGDDLALKTLITLADMKLISLASACLRNNDLELSQWSVFLLHEFVIRKVEIGQIVKIKGLVKLMGSFIRTSDTIIPRIVLRTLKSICDNSGRYWTDQRWLLSGSFKR